MKITNGEPERKTRLVRYALTNAEHQEVIEYLTPKQRGKILLQAAQIAARLAVEILEIENAK